MGDQNYFTAKDTSHIMGDGRDSSSGVWWTTRPWPYYYPVPYYTSPNTGWICPKCQAANAPHVSQCPCSTRVYGTTSTFTITGDSLNIY
jgi:hypothetical protein